MDTIKAALIEAEKKAQILFRTAEQRKLIISGKTECSLNKQMFDLAEELFGIKKFWHKRIIRSGPNTLHPYDDNPPDLTIQENDILFFDFGPVFDTWEADLGRTYVLGNDPYKLKLKNDIELAWNEAKRWFHKQSHLTGSQYFNYIVNLAHQYGWEYGSDIAGHLIGQFPHERLEPENYGLYVHAQNHNDMFAPDSQGQQRNWILEIHFIDKAREIGGFYEQLLTV
ncbi:MAG: M24 family metallopeptidase [Ginsengibacter sp.]